MKTEIKYANENIVALDINGAVFFIRIRGVPQIFDHSGIKLNFTNIDSWLAANTQNKYTYSNLCDLAAAFASGFKAGYDKDYIEDIVDESIVEAIHIIMRKGYLFEYSLSYWIELLDMIGLETLIHKLRDNFDDLYKKYPEGLVNDLSRMAEVCEVRQYNHLLQICNNLMKRTNRMLSNPKFPNTDELDNRVISSVRNNIKIDDDKSVLTKIIVIADQLGKHNLFVKTDI